MAAIHHHHMKALTPTWLLVKATPPQPSRAAAPAYSPLLLSPSVWQKAQNEKKRKAEDGRVDHPGSAGGVPASPRISCMGQVKGGRRCSSARGGPAVRGSGSKPEHAGGRVAVLVMALFGRRRGRKSRACSKVRDVPSDSSSSGSTNWGGRARAAAAARPFDPPLPAVRRPARDENAPSLWERRRGGGMALEGLQLT